MKEGTLYPVLHGLEREGWWRRTSRRPPPAGCGNTTTSPAGDGGPEGGGPGLADLLRAVNAVLRACPALGWRDMDRRQYTDRVLTSLRRVTAKEREAIRQELDRQVERYNGMKQDNQINFMGGPITRLDVAIGSEAQVPVALKDYLLETGLLLLFLLLVPALNLLGVIQSAVQKRRAEMGVRKAFGATTGTLLCQVLYENGLTTLIGGVVGFGLSLLFLLAG